MTFNNHIKMNVGLDAFDVKINITIICKYSNDYETIYRYINIFFFIK
jgi:hypothetical protein